MGSNPLSQLPRLYQTVRHLEARQLWYLGRYRVLPQRHRSPCKTFSGELSLRRNISHRVGFEPPVPQCDSIVSDRGEFTFVGKTVHLGWPPNWRMADKEDRLWCYNLHYHDYIWGLSFQEALILAESWIDSCKFQHGAASWRPYPISVRLGNWLKYFFATHIDRCQAEPRFTERLLESITTQTDWLLKNLEIHLLGNHLFENAVALCFVGAFFDGPLAETCAKRGLDVMQCELDKQILPDGGHFERSPMYHSRCLYLLADLYNLGMEKVMPQLEDYLLRMWSWLQSMCHPDGQIALFNDAAHNVYLSPVSLSAYLSRLLQREPPHSSGSFGLSDSGYFGWTGPDGEYVVCDAGSIGPDYIPGHAHADMFSFELSLKGFRVIVDSGVYDYEPGSMRQYCRSTRAHNTVEIDGQDQCEMWGAFRVARRGNPQDVKWQPFGEGFHLSAWHDGYKRLKGRPIHRRDFSWYNSGRLMVKDRVIASYPQNIVSRIHLHPDCKIEHIDDSSVQAAYPTGRFKISFQGKGKLTVDKSLYCPNFGRKFKNKALAYSISGSNIETSFRIQKLHG